MRNKCESNFECCKLFVNAFVLERENKRKKKKVL
jgi:hypothetical protein